LLITVARDLFARDGYAATSLTAVVEVAGVTKGALYHHFGGKKALFLAVYQAEWARLASVIAEAHGRKRDPWEGFRAGVEAFLNALLDPKVQRILLVDAPGALGEQAGLGDRSAVGSLAQIKRGLQYAIDAKSISAQPVEPLAHIIYGAVCACAQLVARSAEPEATLREANSQLHTMLDAFARR
jgi:AcrR family transcriptional regulator